MLERISDDADVEAVVVHKVDRLARNMEDHIAIRTLLRRRGVTLVSVTENLDETASGRLVEGIHALMAEFHSANLANEVRKGMRQKAKSGGYPHKAPLGYLNVREPIGGRQVAHIVPDPGRAPLVTQTFELYTTDEWTIERLVHEMADRGLRNRGRSDYPASLLTVSGLAALLANPAYTGIVEWDGVSYPGQHEALVGRATFEKVQELLVARAARGTRERRHHHYLKGLLTCGVCGRRLSIQRSKGTYIYFYCLGQKDRRSSTGCWERYVAADQLEAEIEDLYKRVEVPKDWAEGLTAAIATEVASRSEGSLAERELLARKHERAEAERFKLMEAYYANAIDVAILRAEQERIAPSCERSRHGKQRSTPPSRTGRRSWWTSRSGSPRPARAPTGARAIVRGSSITWRSSNACSSATATSSRRPTRSRSTRSSLCRIRIRRCGEVFTFGVDQGRRAELTRSRAG
jgi:site-specific DNA recombinase